jgi:hypothetical protein
MTTVNASASSSKVNLWKRAGRRTRLSFPADIAAYPNSVNALNPGTNDDVRTPEKLIDGHNDDTDGSHSWIAPILPNAVRRSLLVASTSELLSRSLLRSIDSSSSSIDPHRSR